MTLPDYHPQITTELGVQSRLAAYLGRTWLAWNSLQQCLGHQALPFAELPDPMPEERQNRAALESQHTSLKPLAGFARALIAIKLETLSCLKKSFVEALP